MGAGVAIRCCSVDFRHLYGVLGGDPTIYTRLRSYQYLESCLARTGDPTPIL